MPRTLSFLRRHAPELALTAGLLVGYAHALVALLGRLPS